MIKAIIRHAARDTVRKSLYKKNTPGSRKALKSFNKLCRVDNWIRRIIY